MCRHPQHSAAQRSAGQDELPVRNGDDIAQGCATLQIVIEQSRIQRADGLRIHDPLGDRRCDCEDQQHREQRTPMTTKALQIVSGANAKGSAFPAANARERLKKYPKITRTARPRKIE